MMIITWINSTFFRLKTKNKKGRNDFHLLGGTTNCSNVPSKLMASNHFFASFFRCSFSIVMFNVPNRRQQSDKWKKEMLKKKIQSSIICLLLCIIIYNIFESFNFFRNGLPIRIISSLKLYSEKKKKSQLCYVHNEVNTVASTKWHCKLPFVSLINRILMHKFSINQFVLVWIVWHKFPSKMRKKKKRKKNELKHWHWTGDFILTFI